MLIWLLSSSRLRILETARRPTCGSKSSIGHRTFSGVFYSGGIQCMARLVIIQGYGIHYYYASRSQLNFERRGSGYSCSKWDCPGKYHITFERFWMARVLIDRKNCVSEAILHAFSCCQTLISAQGDILLIKSGKKLPADVRFVEISSDAKFDRSILTGNHLSSL